MAFGSWFYKVSNTFQSMLLHREQKIIVLNWVCSKDLFPYDEFWSNLSMTVKTDDITNGTRNEEVHKW